MSKYKHLIKNCPCCGGEADFGYTDEDVYIICLDCGLATSKYDRDLIVGEMNGEGWALYRWNSRVKED